MGGAPLVSCPCPCLRTNPNSLSCTVCLSDLVVVRLRVGIFLVLEGGWLMILAATSRVRRLAILPILFPAVPSPVNRTCRLPT